MGICKKCGTRVGILLDIGFGKKLKPILEGTEDDVNSNIEVESCSHCEEAECAY